MKKSDRKKLEKRLIEKLNDYLVPYDYKMTIRNEEYWFKNEHSEIFVYQNKTPEDSLSIDLRYFAHHDLINEISVEVGRQTLPSWQQGSFFYNASKRDYGGLIADMVNCSELNKPPLYLIKNEMDIDTVFSHQKEFLERVVFKYFEHFKTLESIYLFLSPYVLSYSESKFNIEEKSDKTLWPYMNPSEYRSLLISSWMIQRGSYEEIWNKVKGLFKEEFIFKNYELLDTLLRNEYS